MKRLLAAFVLLVSLLAAQPVMALDLLGPACQAGGNASESTACSGDGQDHFTGADGIIGKATKLIALIAGVAAIILIIVSGIYFVTANGDASKVGSAKHTLIGAIVGIVIVVAAQAILNFVLKKV